MANLLRVIQANKWLKKQGKNTTGQKENPILATYKLDYAPEDFKRLKTIPAQPIGDLIANKDTLSLFHTNEDDVRNLPMSLLRGSQHQDNIFNN